MSVFKTVWCLAFALYLVSALPCSAQSQPSRSTHKVTVHKSFLKILGTTNVNTFECVIPDRGNTQPLIVSSTWSDQVLSFDGLTFTFQIAQFDCGNKMMNKDLQDLLQASIYPQILLKVNRIYVKPNNTSMERVNVTADVEVKMSGKSRSYHIYDGQVINLTDEKMIFKACQQIKFSDFELAPPEKLMGLVKTQDALTIEFEIGLLVNPH
jgi:hypothetical protein